MTIYLSDNQAKRIFHEYKLVKRCRCGKKIKKLGEGSNGILANILLTDDKDKLHDIPKVEYMFLCKDCFGKMSKAYIRITGSSDGR